MKNLRQNKDFCRIAMPSEKNNILEFNQYIKSYKMSYIIHADIESLNKKIGEYANNLENSSTTKIGEHIPCRYSMSTFWAFNHIENKHTLNCGKNCMKKFCECLREHAKNIIDFEKQKSLSLTKEELKSHQDANVCYICGKRILKKLPESINYWKVRDCCHYERKYKGTAHSICNLKFNVSNEISVAFHDDSNYDYNLIKELAN